jgi:hypothetical protein
MPFMKTLKLLTFFALIFTVTLAPDFAHAKSKKALKKEIEKLLDSDDMEDLDRLTMALGELYEKEKDNPAKRKELESYMLKVHQKTQKMLRKK